MKSIVSRFFESELKFDPSDSQFINDPYRTYERLRKKAPVFQSAEGFWVLSRYQDVADALVNPDLGNAPSKFAITHPRNKDKYLISKVAGNILPFLDSPQHDIPRKLILQAYRNCFKENAPDLDQMARAQWQACSNRSEIEILNDFSTPYAFGVMCHLLDLPAADVPKLENWCESFFYLFMPIRSKDILNQVERHLEEFRDYLKAKLDQRRTIEGNDLLSHLHRADYKGENLNEDQIIDNAILLFADGIENVDTGIANALWVMLRNPKEFEKLQKDPTLIPKAADECLRFESPAQYVGRIARKDLEFKGQQIKKDMPVLLLLGSANRDPEVFEKADFFNIERSPNKHLSFGRAKHSCIGGGLVKQELVAVLTAITGSGDRLSLKDKKVKWLERPGHRWMKELNVKLN